MSSSIGAAGAAAAVTPQSGRTPSRQSNRWQTSSPSEDQDPVDKDDNGFDDDQQRKRRKAQVRSCTLTILVPPQLATFLTRAAGTPSARSSGGT